MVDTSLEIECESCGESLWYSGDKDYPNSVECPECGKNSKIPEEG